MEIINFESFNYPKQLQLSWHCKRCRSNGIVSYLVTLPFMVALRAIATYHDNVSPKCVSRIVFAMSVNQRLEILGKEPTMIKRIDNKHSVTDKGVIIKTSSGAPIPDHEPKILFRGRDRLALPMLQFYLTLCLEDGCTKYQEESMRSMIKEFADFREKFSATMKQPGSTSGR